jgi:hypothetical protein
LLSVDPANGSVHPLRLLQGDWLGSTFGSSYTTEALPEPATLALLALGAAFLLRRLR